MSAKPRHSAKAQREAGRSARKAPTEKAAAPPATEKKIKRTAEAEPLDGAAIEQVVAQLGPADRATVQQILSVLAEHLGSPEAARLWLVTPAPEFGKPPLTAIAEGKAQVVRTVLESRWGPSPSYA